MRRILLTLALVASSGALACADEDPMEPTTNAAAVVPGGGATHLTFMTRNVYLGFDIDQVLSGDMDIEDAVPALLGTNFAERAERLADEIEAANPALVGLQEVINYRVEVPSDLDFVADAATPFIPFLQILQAALAARGLDYVVVANNPTTDVEVPVPTAMSPNGYMDIRYTDHDVILARGDVELGAVTTQLYVSRLTFMLLGMIPGERPLGFAAVEAEVNGIPLLFVTTHLETQSFTPIQEAQTAELLAWLDDQELPIVLVGDFNSAANPGAPEDKLTDTYGMLLDAGFQDLWVKGKRQNEGLTCCHTSDLRGRGPFDQRIDLILFKGDASLLGGYTTSIIGDNPSKLTESGMWPSDHAGVVATITVPPGQGL